MDAFDSAIWTQPTTTNRQIGQRYDQHMMDPIQASFPEYTLENLVALTNASHPGSSMSRSTGPQPQSHQPVLPNQTSQSQHAVQSFSPFNDVLHSGLPSTSSALPPNQFYSTTSQPSFASTSANTPFSYHIPTYSTPAVDSAHNHFTPFTLSSYSSLDGATGGTISLASSQQSSPIAIDPALMMVPSLNSSNMYGQLPIQSNHGMQSTVSPSLLHVPPQQHQQHQQQQQQQQHYLSPVPSISTPPIQSASATPPPAIKHQANIEAIRSLLYIKTLEKSPGPTAESLIKLLTHPDGVNETDHASRLEILGKLRDGAGQEFFKVWAQNQKGLDVLNSWLKTAFTQLAEWEDTLMPLLHVIDRLPLGLEELKNSKFGKLVVKITKEPPSTAVKDMALHLEQKWRSLLQTDKKDEGERSKLKRKTVDPPLKNPPTKRPAVGGPSSLTAVNAKSAATVKKEAPRPGSVTTKDAKSDSSFFSAPKPKPKLPSFKKVTPKEEPPNPATISQPSNTDAFQEALKSMKRGGSTDLGSGASVTPNTSQAAVGSSTTTQLNRLGKKKKSVTFASDDKLELIKYIEKAIYDDDDGEQIEHINVDLRELEKAEGRALHNHVFEELIDWSEPMVIETPPDSTLEPRGGQSEERNVQTEREMSALMATYMPTQIPDNPSDLHPELASLTPDETQIKIMLPGSEVEGLALPSVNDLLAQLVPSVPVPPTGPASSSLVPPFQPPAVQPQEQQPQNNVMSSLEQFGIDPASLQSLVQSSALNQLLSGGGLAQLQTQAPLGSQPPSGPMNGDISWGSEPSWDDGMNGGGGGSGPATGPRGPGGPGGRWPNEAGSRDSGWKSRGGQSDRGWDRNQSRKHRPARNTGRGNRSPMPCNFWHLGQCRFGDACNFYHDPELAPRD